jgi:DNA-binding transcriptional ArsR family regulator
MRREAMISQDTIREFSRAVEGELREDILPFWMNYAVDQENGGFYGEVSSERLPVPHAPKGSILNSRILWTFSHAYHVYKDPAYLKMAEKTEGKVKGKVVEKVGETGEKTREITREKIISLIKGNPKITTTKLAEKTGLSLKGIEWNIKSLKENGLLHRIGPDKGGYWEVVKKPFLIRKGRRLPK